MAIGLLTDICISFFFGFREIYISFGGLQLLLRGSPSSLARFQLDKNYFMLMRKM
jgi:DNA-directed RNA polymerase I, II, and III subunit RPABC3